MKKTIAYYISDYGYGHAARSIAIMRKLLEKQDVYIIVCHSFALGFIKESLTSSRVSFRDIKTDVGYFLIKDSIHLDKYRMREEYKNFVVNWEDTVLQEIEFLTLNKVDLVVSDISPLPFEAAEKLGTPSVGVSNFTWYTAYQDLIAEAELKTLKGSYQKMKYFFSLAGSNEKWKMESSEYGFFSRDINVQEVERIKGLVNPNGDKKVIFLGLGMKIDVGSLEQLPIWDSPECVFLVSSNVHVSRTNVYQIPLGYIESQNYIAASDLVISKAGWGMIGEAISTNVPLLILNRPSMREDQNTINYLRNYGVCEMMDWEDFKTYQFDHMTINRLCKSIKESFIVDQAMRIAIDLLKIVEY